MKYCLQIDDVRLSTSKQCLMSELHPGTFAHRRTKNVTQHSLLDEKGKLRWQQIIMYHWEGK